MSMDNRKTPYELAIAKLMDGGNMELTIDTSKTSSVIDVTSAPSRYWTKEMAAADAWVNKGDAMTCIASNTASSIAWENKNYIDYIEFSKIPLVSKYNWKTDSEKKKEEKEKEHKEKMNEAEKENARKIAIKFEPKQILQNGPVTIVFWKDGTKTLVRRSENSADDPYSAFCAALAKKIYGNNSRVKKILEKKTVKAKAKEKKGEKKDGGNAENPEG